MADAPRRVPPDSPGYAEIMDAIRLILFYGVSPSGALDRHYDRIVAAIRSEEPQQ